MNVWRSPQAMEKLGSAPNQSPYTRRRVVYLGRLCDCSSRLLPLAEHDNCRDPVEEGFHSWLKGNAGSMLVFWGRKISVNPKFYTSFRTGHNFHGSLVCVNPFHDVSGLRWTLYPAHRYARISLRTHYYPRFPYSQYDRGNTSVWSSPLLFGQRCLVWVKVCV